MPRPKRTEPRRYLRKRPDNGIWEVRWFEAGRPRSLSTGATDEHEANRFLAQYIVGLERPEPPKEPAIDDILDGYLADRQGHVEAYGRLVECAVPLRRHVGALKPTQLPRHLYRQRREKDGVAAGTLTRELITLRAALNWARKEAWIVTVPALTFPPRQAPRERFLSRAEAQKLVAATKAPHLRLFILLALHTAARKGAILDLTWDRVDLETRFVHFRRAGRKETKKRRVSVPINTVLLGALQEAREVRTTEYVIEYHGQKAGNIRHAFERTVERAGIAHCTRHDLRRTAASWMAMAGVPLDDIARVLGDTREMAERVYAKFHPEHLRSAVDALAGESEFLGRPIQKPPRANQTSRG